MSIRYAKDQPAGFTNYIKNVAVIGAGGEVGKPIATELLKTGKYNVTAITRFDSKTSLPTLVNVIRVNYDDEQTLIDALKGQQFIFITLAATAARDTQAKIITAAAKAGVSWVMPNSYAPDFANKALMTDIMIGPAAEAGVASVEQAGMSWIYMTCGFWYEFSLSVGSPWCGFDILDKKVTFYDDGNTRINMSTWEQCGRAAAQLLSLKELPDDEMDQSPTISQWRNKILYISSFLASQRDMLDSLHRVMGTTDDDWQIDHEPTDTRYKRGLQILQSGNIEGFGMAMFARTYFPNGDGNYEAKYGLANKELGLPKENFDEATKLAVKMAEAGFGNSWKEINGGAAK
ncbi:nmrA-like family domain-containing protein [Trichoderma breve]|uniref:NmrA-like family domain-containing protein n=1 Tax=Trichoderma breve TaxID=2034170 RepID=A0A9W9BG66_9HYPO|nr:nmrA-like family domain-containing protein [Trichoderma breve]KAJ4859288.1 nmrA-like family domain-containing protein [Trichoderma breve]